MYLGPKLEEQSFSGNEGNTWSMTEKWGKSLCLPLMTINLSLILHLTFCSVDPHDDCWIGCCEDHLQEGMGTDEPVNKKMCWVWEGWSSGRSIRSFLFQIWDHHHHLHDGRIILKKFTAGILFIHGSAVSFSRFWWSGWEKNWSRKYYYWTFWKEDAKLLTMIYRITIIPGPEQVSESWFLLSPPVIVMIR